MQTPEALLRLLMDRFAQTPYWFKAGYEQALEHVEDRTHDPQNPYYFGPTFDGSAFKTAADGPMVNDEFSELDPETTRQIAFEMLVLADLAEIAPAPKGSE